MKENEVDINKVLEFIMEDIHALSSFHSSNGMKQAVDYWDEILSNRKKELEHMSFYRGDKGEIRFRDCPHQSDHDVYIVSSSNPNHSDGLWDIFLPSSVEEIVLDSDQIEWILEKLQTALEVMEL